MSNSKVWLFRALVAAGAFVAAGASVAAGFAGGVVGVGWVVHWASSMLTKAITLKISLYFLFIELISSLLNLAFQRLKLIAYKKSLKWI